MLGLEPDVGSVLEVGKFRVSETYYIKQVIKE